MTKTSALFGASAVILGAFGAHTLKEFLTPESLASYQTGVLYHLLHAVAILALSDRPQYNLSSKLWTLGILLFSGSIYLLSIDELMGLNLSFLGPITPLGGLAFISGWLLLLKKSVTKETRVSDK